MKYLALLCLLPLADLKPTPSAKSISNSWPKGYVNLVELDNKGYKYGRCAFLFGGEENEVQYNIIH